jgi:hypothetical protein
MNMSNLEVAPKAIEPLDYSKPDGLNTWYTDSQEGSSNLWEFSVGELYGCVCHRAFDELARSPLGSNPAGGLQRTEQAAKKAGEDQRSASEVSSDAISRM